MKNRLVMLVAILLLAGVNALRGAAPDTNWLGVLWTKGSVSVGGAKVVSGTTVLPGDVITTAPGASAWLRFRTPASTILLADTEVALLASDSAPSLLLRRGTVVVDEKVTDPVQIAVPGGYVLVKGDPQEGAQCELAALQKGTTVSVKRGRAEIHSLGDSMTVHAGQTAQVAGGAEGGEQVAGKIRREVPEGVIQRAGQTEEVPLKLNEVIDWNDVVRTLDAGRARIVLVDGSTLNVGSHSTIRILKHDAQTHQTLIDMGQGKIHATPQRITNPSGKFELTTRTADVQTADGPFVVSTDGNRTRVCGVDGNTQVRSSDPGIPTKVTVRKDECTWVMLGQAPTDPVQSSGDVMALLADTAVTDIEALAPAAGMGELTKVLIGAGAAAALGGVIAAIVLSGSSSPPASTNTAVP